MKKSYQNIVPIVGVGLLAILFVVYIISGVYVRLGRPNPLLNITASESADPLVTKVGTETPVTVPTLSPDDITLGKGAIRIFEFSDFSCPYCAEMATKLRRAVATHPDIQIVWKDFPVTSLHADSPFAHIAARCAAKQGKFWEYHDQLFSQKPPFPYEKIIAIANQLNLNSGTFVSCFQEDQQVRQSIAQTLNEGNALNIDGTPYLFIGDQRVSGLVSDEELEQIITLHTRLGTTP